MIKLIRHLRREKERPVKSVNRDYRVWLAKESDRIIGVEVRQRKKYSIIESMFPDFLLHYDSEKSRIKIAYLNEASLKYIPLVLTHETVHKILHRECGIKICHQFDTVEQGTDIIINY